MLSLPSSSSSSSSSSSATQHYRTPPSSYTFHAYSPPASPPPPPPAVDDLIAPPAMSAKRASRLSAPFPTFLYANEPPPVTARNKQRVRPTPAQLADLKTLYAATPHPSREEREALGCRIGMRYQSVTNWFQNQRSTAKKRESLDDERYASAAAAAHADQPAHALEHRPPPPPPPPSHQDIYPSPRRIDPVRDIIAHATRPSPPPAPQQQQQQQQQQHPPTQPSVPLPLPLSGSSILPTLPPPPSLLSSFQTSSSTPTKSSPHPPHTPAHAPTPAPTPPTDPHRGKRSRPTPHQLAVLRALHAETTSPSIEARVRVGREIGMELGKVTNWFRNLRQTARKKERRAAAAEGDEEGGGGEGEGYGGDGGDGGDGEREVVVGSKRSAHAEDVLRPQKRTRRQVLLEHHPNDEEDEEGEDTASSEGAPDMMDVESTESDAAPHEAVTPEPLLLAPPAPTQPHHDENGDGDGEGGGGGEGGLGEKVGAPEKLRPAASVDDALLLLALHDARS